MIYSDPNGIGKKHKVNKTLKAKRIRRTGQGGNAREKVVRMIDLEPCHEGASLCTDKLHAFLKLALDGDEWRGSQTGRFTVGK